MSDILEDDEGLFKFWRGIAIGVASTMVLRREMARFRDTVGCMPWYLLKRLRG